MSDIIKYRGKLAKAAADIAEDAAELTDPDSIQANAEAAERLARGALYLTLADNPNALAALHLHQGRG